MFDWYPCVYGFEKLAWLNMVMGSYFWVDLCVDEHGGVGLKKKRKKEKTKKKEKKGHWWWRGFE